MLVSTSRYTDGKTREFAKAFAASCGSTYCARGKKSVETLVSFGRKAGENTLAFVSPGKISFISISLSSWEWKKETLLVSGFKIHPGEGGEPGSFEGSDGPILEKLFGSDSFHSGEALVRAEKGKLEFIEEGKTTLEIDYKVIVDEKQDRNDS